MAERTGWLAPAFATLLCFACAYDPRNIHVARTEPEWDVSHVAPESWPLCVLIGPGSAVSGIHGTDLGFTVKDPAHPDRLAALFGDTWAETRNGCGYPVSRSDDLEASLPVERPPMLHAGEPTGSEGAACGSLDVPPMQAGPTPWRPIRLFDSPAAGRDDTPLDTGPLRTPVAAFSDGSHVFALYNRDEASQCKVSSECPDGMACSVAPDYRGRRLGECSHTSGSAGGAAPAYCRDVSDCGPGLQCSPTTRGVCLARRPFALQTRHGLVEPPWYRDDPRLGMAYVIDVAARLWPDRPSDYAVVGRFVTNRFVNVAARTVAHFDPEHAESNDYGPGFQTLLLWGRPSFFGSGGAQSLPFLLYQSLEASHGDPRALKWEPHFFAGYGATGKPRWSTRERDAIPVYGTAAKLSDPGSRIEWTEPEFDYVNQMSVSWVAPLKRWVMLYGGDVPAFMVRDPHTGVVPEPFYAQPTAGAIHFRVSPHPWGRASGRQSERDGWTSPEPLLTREEAARYLACGRGGRKELPGCVKDGEGSRLPPALATPRASLGELVGQTFTCFAGDLAEAVQADVSGNPIGRLYAPNVIEAWTENVSDASADELAAEILLERVDVEPLSGRARQIASSRASRRGRHRCCGLAVRPRTRRGARRESMGRRLRAMARRLPRPEVRAPSRPRRSPGRP